MRSAFRREASGGERQRRTAPELAHAHEGRRVHVQSEGSDCCWDQFLVVGHWRQDCKNGSGESQGGLATEGRQS